MLDGFSKWLRSMRLPIVVNIYADGVEVAADTTIDAMNIYKGQVGFVRAKGPVPDNVSKYLRDSGLRVDSIPIADAVRCEVKYPSPPSAP